MKFYYLLFIFGVCSSGWNSANAQTFHQLLGTTDSDNPSCIEKTIDDGYIISGENNIYVNT